MASLGHLAVGVSAARLYRQEIPRRRVPLASMLVWSALSFLPDADVIGFQFGIRYADEWGHRGASHSLMFAIAVGAAIGALAPLFKRPALRTAITAILVLASHPLLDTLTNGGLGCAVFWPFANTRYFAPWRPIPVSPIGLGFFSPYGMFVALVELVVFSPLLWFGLSRTIGRDVTTGPNDRKGRRVTIKADRPR
ncbi:MAG TPA: metal-dependent hydrolase [Vicinamibacterales bacterium]|nr:metal-dependent hydrolase [Vicinamibacterales bacterium]